MSLYQKLLLCNVVRHKISCYTYVLFGLLCICYIFIYVRFNRIPNLTFNHGTQTRKLHPTSTRTTTKSTENYGKSMESTSTKPKYPMKYILQWTNPKKYPFVYFGEGNSVFVNKSCQWTNCYVTGDRNLLGIYTEFDVIMFNGPQLPLMLSNRDWPKERLPRQKYVYANIESAANNPVRTNVFNGFFNWTWTYKLNSDAVWGYIIVRDSENNVVGPRENMQWKETVGTAAVEEEMKTKLKTKNKAAAWMCSSKDSISRREQYVKTLQEHLSKYYLKVDIFGECGDHKCPKEKMTRCLKLIQKRYYFYLAFENSFSDDYVTEKVLYALNYDTVPIVYGGANYSRFLPPGSYLDAAKLGPKKLAQVMVDLIQKPIEYSQFFRWQSQYFIHPPHYSPDTDSYCNFCAMINNETLMKTRTTYDKFNAWWMQKVMRVL